MKKLLWKILEVDKDMEDFKGLREEYKEQREKLFEETREKMSLKCQLAEQVMINNKVVEVRNELGNKYNKLKKKLRDQNEADLFLVSAKIQDKVINGEKMDKTHQLIREQSALQGRRQQISQDINIFAHGYLNNFL